MPPIETKPMRFVTIRWSGSSIGSTVVLLLAVVAFSSSCDGESFGLHSPPAIRSIQNGGVNRQGETETVRDDPLPPRFDGLEDIACAGWGRLHFEWSSATDDGCRPHEIRYRLEGFDPRATSFAGLTSAGSIVEPRIVHTTQPGAVSAELTVPLTHSLWTLTAIDLAGNESTPIPPKQVLTRPRLIQVETSAVSGLLQACRRNTDGVIYCGGENGRYALWDSSGWHERSISSPSPVRLLQSPEGDNLLITDVQEFSILPDGSLAAVPMRFETQPSFPFRRVLAEPTGLFVVLDGLGRVWASNATDFRHLDNPLLTEFETRCDTLVDLHFSADHGFAWCENGRQFLLRTSDRQYEWVQLPDSEGFLLDQQPLRQVVFGAGRQMFILTYDGEVWRYDIEGWNRLFSADDTEYPATAMVYAGEPGNLLIASGSEIFEIDTLGMIELVSELPVHSPVIYFEYPDEESIAVSTQGEVVSISGREILRSLPPGSFLDTVESAGRILAAIAQRPSFGLYRHGVDGWVFEPLPSLPADFMPHGVTQAAGGALLFAGDSGSSDGRIYRVDENDVEAERFVYPPPDGSVQGDPLSPTGMRPLSSVPTLERELIGVPADELAEPPGVPPAIRAIEADEACDAAVAVGEGGSIWYAIESGWLWIDSGLTLPLLSVAILDSQRYVAGGVEGTLVTCQCDRCHRQSLPIGDIRSFTRVDDTLFALGSSGIAIRNDDESWSLLPIEFEEPYPSGAPPTGFLAMTGTQGQRWVLADDGSIWFEVGQRYRPMAVVDRPLDLGHIDGVGTVVATEDSLLSIELPANVSRETSP